mgnify:CR=1 FL=1
MPPVALVIGAVACVAGTVASISNQRKSAGLQRRQQELASRRSRRQAIRQAQLQRAQSVATAQAAGSLGGSGGLGGIGAIGSQLGEALGFSNQMSGLSQQIGAAQSRAQLFGDVANLGMVGVNFGLSQGAKFSDIIPNRPPQGNNVSGFSQNANRFTQGVY